MSERGFPVEDFEEHAADVSADHPHVVAFYRSAHGVWLANERGGASSEDLRQALVHYGKLLDDLLGDAAEDEPLTRDTSEAPTCAQRAFGHPHLLERRPVVGSPLAREQSRAVGQLETEIHLQAAVIGGARIGPRSFVTVNARPRAEMRRMHRDSLCTSRDVFPGANACLRIGRRTREREP